MSAEKEPTGKLKGTGMHMSTGITSEKPIDPEEGSFFFDTSTEKMMVYTGSSWKEVSATPEEPTAPSDVATKAYVDKVSGVKRGPTPYKRPYPGHITEALEKPKVDVPSWLHKGLVDKSAFVQKRSIIWASQNMEGEALDKFYKTALRLFERMTRDNAKLVDKIGVSLGYRRLLGDPDLTALMKIRQKISEW